jgi:hypothetical protein
MARTDQTVEVNKAMNILRNLGWEIKNEIYREDVVMLDIFKKTPKKSTE